MNPEDTSLFNYISSFIDGLLNEKEKEFLKRRKQNEYDRMGKRRGKDSLSKRKS